MSDQNISRRTFGTLDGNYLRLPETNTYIPTMTGLSTAGSTTYTTQQGNWVRVGNVMIVQFEVTWTAATGTGVMAISLPSQFPAAATMEFPIAIYVSNITFAAGAPYALVNTGTAYIVLGTPTSNGGTATLSVEAAGTVYGTAIYFIE